jgi:hypothetical protein
MRSWHRRDVNGCLVQTGQPNMVLWILYAQLFGLRAAVAAVCELWQVLCGTGELE